MIKYTCQCCGANISPHSLKCEYCGTEYKEDNYTLVRVQHYQAPIDTYRAGVTVTNLDLQTMGEKSGEIIADTLARRLTEVIKSNISINVRNMLEYNSQLFTGTIKVVKPIHDYDNIDRIY